MKNLTVISKNICDLLKEEYNEVIYKAWLFFTENAFIEDENIVITVPNHYIKETLGERYLSHIEDLYRTKVDFSRLIVKTDSEINESKKHNTLEEYLESENTSAFLEKIMLSSNKFSVSF
ncbi:hypothetical protein HMPREF1982_01288 [Clostridiales bacterium oral taxon 876 str. F0540]|nr:hypothetical protein HMPREF1982_01288 [Clostridiales bacterium oral taxon 876 str. F0540]